MKSHIWIFWIHNMEQFSHPERIETCFLVVIECYRWFKMIYKYSIIFIFNIPIFYFLVKDPTSPSFSGLLQGILFAPRTRITNISSWFTYHWSRDVPRASNWSDLPARRPHFNIHKRWVVFWTCETICFFVGMVLLQFLYSQEPLKEFEQIKQHAWKFKFLN